MLRQDIYISTLAPTNQHTVKSPKNNYMSQKEVMLQENLGISTSLYELCSLIIHNLANQLTKISIFSTATSSPA